MTDKLTQLFDLPNITTDDDGIVIATPEESAVSAKTLSNIEKIDSALPAVKGLEASDADMDELAALATESYKDLVDLGMNVESRLSGEIFNAASSMLGHAITAKNAKINKKLKMIELQLKKLKLDQSDTSDIATSEGIILDRNELLDRLLKGTDKPTIRDKTQD